MIIKKLASKVVGILLYTKKLRNNIFELWYSASHIRETALTGVRDLNQVYRLLLCLVLTKAYILRTKASKVLA